MEDSGRIHGGGFQGFHGTPKFRRCSTGDHIISYLVLAELEPPVEISGSAPGGFIDIKGEVKAKIKMSPVVVFGVLSRMVLVRGS